MLITFTREVAVTVALRWESSSMPASPKTSPGPRSAMCSPSRVTSAVPSSIAIKAFENPPSLIRALPSSTSLASANTATFFSSSSEASENSGMRFN